jgi:hypothetical protein
MTSRQSGIRTVGYWKSRGFRFELAEDAIGCTRVSADIDFGYVQSRKVSNAGDFFLAYTCVRDLVTPAEGRAFLAAGSYLEDDIELPWMLIPAEARARLDDSCVTYNTAHEAARKAERQATELLKEVLQ